VFLPPNLRSVALRISAVLITLVLTVAGCGGGGGGKGSGRESGSSGDPHVAALVREAASVRASDFPAPRGRTLQAIANTVRAGPQVGLAGSIFLPGADRFAFGVITSDKRFLYGKSALYVARTPRARARGPYPAPADSIVPKPPFLSRGAAADTADIKAIYAARVPFPGPGRYAVLAVTKVGAGFDGGASEVTVKRSSPIPNVGERPPRISTDTVASAGGDVSKIDTRLPPDDMHKVDFKNVLGKRPVALLFSTPQLCQSRVCGPVTDIALQLESEFHDRVTFIHQEVYVDNQLNKGLRPQLRAFHLQSEPWLFTFDRQGRVAARLEGSFGVTAMRRAVRAALR
jgi:hypothetical protein